MKKLPKEVQQWLREGMFDEGWKIEITHRDGDKITNNRKFISERLIGKNNSSTKNVILFTVERMLEEFEVSHD